MCHLWNTERVTSLTNKHTIIFLYPYKRTEPTSLVAVQPVAAVIDSQVRAPLLPFTFSSTVDIISSLDVPATVKYFDLVAFHRPITTKCVNSLRWLPGRNLSNLFAFTFRYALAHGKT